MMRWPAADENPSVVTAAGDEGDEEGADWSMMRMKPLGPTSSPSCEWLCSRGFSSGGR